MRSSRPGIPPTDGTSTARRVPSAHGGRQRSAWRPGGQQHDAILVLGRPRAAWIMHGTWRRSFSKPSHPGTSTSSLFRPVIAQGPNIGGISPCTWKVAGLLHGRKTKRGARVRVLVGRARRHPIVALQEVHGDVQQLQGVVQRHRMAAHVVVSWYASAAMAGVARLVLHGGSDASSWLASSW